MNSCKSVGVDPKYHDYKKKLSLVPDLKYAVVRINEQALVYVLTVNDKCNEGFLCVFRFIFVFYVCILRWHIAKIRLLVLELKWNRPLLLSFSHCKGKFGKWGNVGVNFLTAACGDICAGNYVSGNNTPVDKIDPDWENWIIRSEVSAVTSVKSLNPLINCLFNSIDFP